MITDCIDYGGKMVRALCCRRLWEKIHGPIPEGLWLLHSCDNPRCINPEHWFLGTASDNIKDTVKKGRHNPSGNSERYITNPSLTIEDVLMIRKEPEKEWKWAPNLFNVHIQTIRRIIKRKTWRHI
jgi:hypothetical protein